MVNLLEMLNLFINHATSYHLESLERAIKLLSDAIRMLHDIFQGPENKIKSNLI